MSQLYSGRRNLWANKEKYCDQRFSYNSGLAMGCFILDEWTLEGSINRTRKFHSLLVICKLFLKFALILSLE